MRSYTLLPRLALAPYVLYYNVVQTERAETFGTLVGLPADSLQLTISFGTRVPLVSSDVSTLSTPLMAIGPSPRSDLIELVGGIDAVSVVFRPGCAGLFLGAPAAEFAGRLVELGALWPAALCQALYDLEPLSPEGRVRRLEAVLLSRLDERFLVPLSVARALKITGRANGQVRVRELADTVGVSERTLQRRLTELVGLSPKGLARVLRVRRAASALHRAPEAAWAELALDCGFFDQAHLTNEMVALTGHTPTAFARLRDRHGFFLKPA